MKYFKRIFILFIAVVFLASNQHSAFAVDLNGDSYNGPDPANGIIFYDGDLVGPCPVGSAAGGGGGGPAIPSGNIEQWVDTYGQAAFNAGKKYGIPYEAILAQAALESGWGNSKLTRQANNFFGIKAGSSWTGPTVSFQTGEQNADGSTYTVTAAFRSYPDAQAGFEGYGEFIIGLPRYAKALQYPGNPAQYIAEIKAGGYATDVSYVSKNVGIQEAITAYVQSKGLFPPSSEVVPDRQPGPSADGSSVPTSANSSGSGCQSGSAGTGAAGVAQIAIREAENWSSNSLGYKKYTMGRGENWCADFATWVYNEAGAPLNADVAGVYKVSGWQIPSVSNLRTYLQGAGTYTEVSANAPPPQIGDIVIYKNGASHTNIVVWAEGYMVKTVGGNQGGGNGQGAYYASSSVTMSSQPFDIRTGDKSISGWGRPTK